MYEGQLVRLRAMDSSDLMKLQDFSNDYSVMRCASGNILYPATVDDAAREMGGNTNRSTGAYQFALETKTDRVLIGQCGFIQINWKNRVGELAILIGDARYRGKGYGADAIRTLCAFGFDEMNLRKIKVSVIDFNTPALRCYEKCGFEVEGRLEKEIYREGAYHDLVLMRLFRHAEEAAWNTQK
ncbi:MAG: GNAT family N-acetyltransferase [Clostridia bacterium]|nr:GNAT family N-acetyltransferase [Clostridia bacterium]